MSGMTLENIGSTELRVTRDFAAPPEAVWKAHTDPAKVQRWMLGPDGWSMPVCEIDATVGGRFRYTWQNEEGDSFTISGQFDALDPHNRIVHTEVMEPFPPVRVETTFHDRDGHTRMVMLMHYPSEDAREGALSSGMSDGMATTYDRLDAMLR